MTIAAIKLKLHSLIDQADDEKVVELYSLLQPDNAAGKHLYDNQTLDMLEARFDGMTNGSIRAISLQETVGNMNRNRKRNAV